MYRRRDAPKVSLRNAKIVRMRVTFTPLCSAAEVMTNETVLDAARRADVPIGNSCGAVGVCGRCCVRVLAGAENLSAPTMIELRVSAQRGFRADERLACQAIVTGDVEVTTSYW
jgi:ferredoxin